MRKIYKINEIREKLRPVFISAPIYRAVLFGSYAKGLADEHSDIDILIDSHGEIHGLHFYSILEDINSVLDKKIDLFEVSEIRPISPVMDDIRNQGVVLYERQR